MNGDPVNPVITPRLAEILLSLQGVTTKLEGAVDRLERVVGDDQDEEPDG